MGGIIYNRAYMAAAKTGLDVGEEDYRNCVILRSKGNVGGSSFISKED